MEFTLTLRPADEQRSDCTVVPAHGTRRLGPSGAALDKASGGALSRLLRRGRFEAKPGKVALFHGIAGLPAERVLVVGCGERGSTSARDLRRATVAAAGATVESGARDAAVYLGEVPVSDRDAYWASRQVAEAFRAAAYRFDECKSEPDEASRPALARVRVGLAEGAERDEAERGLAHGGAIGGAVALARDLGNLPGNICTPSYLAERARTLAEEHPTLSTRVRGEADMKRLGMGTLLSVSRGSREPAQLITVEYKGGRRGDGPVVLIGKGVTFDSGGISIKPAGAMDEMKFDMCGAGSVLAAMRAVAEMALPLNVVGIVPATENLPDGSANKPGDIVTSMSGQTVEVLNTDAEGRLILCDAMTFATRFKPSAVVDCATLTGACVIALGAHAHGLFANDDSLADELLRAGDYAGDRAWHMPLWDEYGEALRSNFADVANVGGREAGAVTAACFLSRFAREFPWAHLDIAGTAWRTGKEKGATGRPVPLLVQYLLDRVQASED